MGFIPPPTEVQTPNDERPWVSTPQVPHWGVVLVHATLVIVGIVWGIITIRSHHSGADLGLVVGLIAAAIAGAVCVFSGYRIAISSSQVTVRSTVGGLRFLQLSLDAISHAYATEIENPTWSPNFSDGSRHPSMPVNPGSAIVLRCDDGSHIRIAIPDPQSVMAALGRLGIESVQSV
ncbi:MAG: hypothetical protein WBD02_00050 [Acidimicrobiia bacterium]